jgi:hypothetical protein
MTPSHGQTGVVSVLQDIGPSYLEMNTEAIRENTAAILALAQKVAVLTQAVTALTELVQQWH